MLSREGGRCCPGRRRCCPGEGGVVTWSWGEGRKVLSRGEGGVVQDEGGRCCPRGRRCCDLVLGEGGVVQGGGGRCCAGEGGRCCDLVCVEGGVVHSPPPPLPSDHVTYPMMHLV